MEEIKRLEFENILWIVFIGLIIGNIIGSNKEIEYLKTKERKAKEEANQIFENVLKVTIIIYLYFFLRNYQSYQESTNKDLYQIKVIGSNFLLIGILCLFYFQKHQETFIGTPGI